MFVIGVLSLFGIYTLLFQLFKNEKLALIGTWALNFSPSFYYYTINPMPDNLALCLAIWGSALFFSWLHNKKTRYLFLSGLFFCIGTLCKLPFIIYFIIPFLYFLNLILKGSPDKNSIVKLITIVGFIFIPAIWYISVIPEWNNNIVIKGILNSNDSTSRILSYLKFNLISNLPELLLNYGSVIFFLAGFYFLFRNKAFRDSRFKLLAASGILVIGYYLFEANAIGKIHDYYLFPFVPLLFTLVAYGAFNLISSKKLFVRYFSVFLLLVLPATCYVRMRTRWDADSPGFNKDLLIYKNDLRNAVPGNALVVTGNDESHSIFFYYIDKKGWSFNDDELTAEKLRSMIKDGAEYLYTDSPKIISDLDIASCFDKLILERESIKIYSLKRLN